MKSSNIFVQAKALSQSLTLSEIQSDIGIMKALSNFTGSSKFIENFNVDPASGNYIYEVSQTLTFFVIYLRNKYNDELKSLAIFMKIMEQDPSKGFDSNDQKLLVDLSSYIFYQNYQKLSHVVIPEGFSDFIDRSKN
ncbi:MAG: hypothetical protein Q8928_16770 [Bacteroidota bacterium]|nr:hypothetical protein [Bacteroidota bacterium]